MVLARTKSALQSFNSSLQPFIRSYTGSIKEKLNNNFALKYHLCWAAVILKVNRQYSIWFLPAQILVKIILLSVTLEIIDYRLEKRVN